MFGVPVAVQPQAEERLFCAACGRRVALTATFCFHCGFRLEKAAVASRLKDRVMRAYSLKEHVSFTCAEISALVEQEAQSRAMEFIRSGAIVRASAQKQQVEKTLDVVFPIIAGSAVIYFLSQALSRAH